MMDIGSILKLVQSGDLSAEEAEIRLKQIVPAEEDLGFAQLDLNREQRTGFPEVIFGEGKTSEQIILIIRKMMAHNDRVLATRIDPVKAVAITETIEGCVYHPTPRAVTWFRKTPLEKHDGYIAIVCAGTSDLPIAEEAALTAECM